MDASITATARGHDYGEAWIFGEAASQVTYWFVSTSKVSANDFSEV
jgi:hypothetical protein